MILEVRIDPLSALNEFFAWTLLRRMIMNYQIIKTAIKIIWSAWYNR